MAALEERLPDGTVYSLVTGKCYARAGAFGRKEVPCDPAAIRAWAERSSGLMPNGLGKFVASKGGERKQGPLGAIDRFLGYGERIVQIGKTAAEIKHEWKGTPGVTNGTFRPAPSKGDPSASTDPAAGVENVPAGAPANPAQALAGAKGVVGMQAILVLGALLLVWFLLDGKGK